MIMNSFFKFHPIGQGGFYTGCLDLYGRNHSQFNFVYDCGTLSERNNLNFAIESYKNRICNKTIDVLFISHLDDDHVNGIKELLKDIICNDVYMPYLSPFPRSCANLFAFVYNFSKLKNTNNNIMALKPGPKRTVTSTGKPDQRQRDNKKTPGNTPSLKPSKSTTKK
jgi:glyoxylase-like metal-dependent hydrolase (beta-lactamase superfamily II)